MTKTIFITEYRWANVLLILAVTATLFLAIDVLQVNIVSDMDETLAMIIAGAIAPIMMVALLIFTSLGSGVKASFFRNEKLKGSDRVSLKN